MKKQKDTDIDIDIESIAEKKISPLEKEVAKHYEVPEGRTINFVCAEFGEVDLRAVTMEFASRLADAGYLKKI